MELKNTYKMKKIISYIFLLCLLTNCSKDSSETDTPTNYNYYYPTEDTNISATEIGDGTRNLDPKGIAVSNSKLYICNGDVLEIFDAETLAYIKTIANYTKGSTTIPFSKLSSISIDNGRIYLGSVDSRLFVMDEKTTNGINTLGNGQWWTTFVHVFGVTVKDGLVFVKEKEQSIKVFETSQITETSNWNLTPIAKLNTTSGFDEIYSMDINSGNLVVAGRNAKGYLYYPIKAIRNSAANSPTTALAPAKIALSESRPVAITFTTEWAIASESVGNSNLLRLYPINEFIGQTYNPRVNASDIMGNNSFGTIISTAQYKDRIFLSDNTNKKIRIIKLNKATIAEQK